MSQNTLELHRRSVEAFNARDIDAFVALCDERVELQSAVTVPGGGAVYYGREGVRRWHRDLQDGFGEDVTIEAEAYYEAGDQTITFHVLHGRGRESGAAVEMPAAHRCEWRDGLMVFFKGYRDREAALADAGIAPDEARPIAP